jgi:hypothetical protein
MEKTLLQYRAALDQRARKTTHIWGVVNIMLRRSFRDPSAKSSANPSAIYRGHTFAAPAAAKAEGTPAAAAAALPMTTIFRKLPRILPRIFRQRTNQQANPHRHVVRKVARRRF